MHSKPLSLSVVMPCFNEADIIEPLLREWTACLDEVVGEYEIVVVNDGSKDGTGRILDKLRREMKHLRVIHQLNGGYTVALRRGIEAARGTYLLQVNSDGRNDCEDFLRLWEKKDGNALVLGARTHRLDPLSHRLASRLLKKTVGWAFKFNLEDPDVPFRIVRRDIAMLYLSRVSPATEAVNVLLACWIKRDYSDRVAEIPVPHRLRSRRRRSLGLMALCSLGLHFAREVYFASRADSLAALPAEA